MRFSSLVRAILAASTHQKKIRGTAAVHTSAPTAPRGRGSTSRSGPFRLLAEAVRTGRPGIIRYTFNLKGAPKTTWYQVEPLPE
jgi:hypothetical protein